MMRLPSYIRKLAGAAVLLSLIVISWKVAKDWAADVPTPDPTITRRVSSAMDDFGFRLLKALAKDTKRNTIISPFGVATAFAMAYNGAAGATKREMAKTLDLGSLSDDDINRANHSLMHSLGAADPEVQPEIANAVWVQKDYPLNPNFRTVCESFYEARASNLDFAGDPKGAEAEINSWVDKYTHHRIPVLAKEVDSHTRLILTDAVHFKGAWSSKFKKEDTRTRPFHLLGGGSRDTAMMEQTADFLYLENKDFQAIRLPYGNERYAMYVYLPREMAGLTIFLRLLDEKHWKQWTEQFASRTTKIVLPKFETAYGQQLNNVLKEMGMRSAFEPMAADFSWIPLNPTPANALYISDVEHKTWVKVDEEGTEAAAATSIQAELLALIGTSNVMTVDHPFFFAITEEQSGALLFAGVVMDPTLKGEAE
jgi:serine protease inhibitor